MSNADRNLAAKVCLVTGASRGIGKGIAAMLSKAGATVYVTGRSVNKEFQDEISAYGGQCFAVQCDHNDDEQVKNVFEKIKNEQDGKLDILVNNAFGGAGVLSKSKGKFWEEPISNWDAINNVGLRSNFICAHHAANMMVSKKEGLIINISSVGGLQYSSDVAYGVGKAGTDRMAADMAVELKKHNIATVSLWPGGALTEFAKEVKEGKHGEYMAELWKPFEGQYIETPEFTGKAVVALGTDTNIMKKTGKILISAELAREYGFKDIGGIQPISFRQVKFLVHRFYPSYEWMVPQFLYFPWWMVAMGTHKFW